MQAMEERKGLVFNIQKFSIHDGTGIRTLVFMKGCPLRCQWCCNPESQVFEKELMFVKKNCIGCGKCADVCSEKCTDAANFAIDRSRCTICGACVKTCYANAKKIVGEWRTVYEILCDIEKDRVFYRNSQGGVTVGGGEPTMQAEFVAELLRECKRVNLHTAMETCGYGRWEQIRQAFEPLDQVFFDLKQMDDRQHRQLTGVGNAVILENARRVAEMGKDITFRIPLIPGCNDDEVNIIETGKFINSLTKNDCDGSQRLGRINVEVLLYHGLGADKYRWMDQDYELKQVKRPEQELKDRCDELLQQCGCNVVE